MQVPLFFTKKKKTAGINLTLHTPTSHVRRNPHRKVILVLELRGIGRPGGSFEQFGQTCGDVLEAFLDFEAVGSSNPNPQDFQHSCHLVKSKNSGLNPPIASIEYLLLQSVLEIP